MSDRTAAKAGAEGRNRTSAFTALLPGIGLCLAITVVALAAQAIEEHVFSHPYVEALVVAILIGIAVRTAWTPGPRFRTGIAFSAKQPLEVAVTLLGASLSLTAIVASGPAVGAAMVVGILIALFQALTQIQEVTLTFVPKIVVVLLVMIVSGSFVGGQIYAFTEMVYGRIVTGFRAVSE